MLCRQFTAIRLNYLVVFTMVSSTPSNLDADLMTSVERPFQNSPSKLVWGLVDFDKALIHPKRKQIAVTITKFDDYSSSGGPCNFGETPHPLRCRWQAWSRP